MSAETQLTEAVTRMVKDAQPDRVVDGRYAQAACRECRMVWDGGEDYVRSRMMQHTQATRHETRVEILDLFGPAKHAEIRPLEQDIFRWFFGWKSVATQPAEGGDGA